MESTFKHLSKLGLAMLIALSAMSCASKSDGGSDGGSSNPGTEEPTDNGNGSGGDGTDATEDFFANEAGGSAVFVIDGGLSTTNLNSSQMALLTKYVGTHPLNKPRNFRIMIDTMDVSDNASGRWGGGVKIGYYDNGQVYAGEFTTQNPSGSDKVRVSYKDVYKKKSNAEFNRWFFPTGGSQEIFHGFFQDQTGAIVVVIDNSATVDLGDGLGTQELSGAIYFKNFKTAPAPQFMDVNNDGEVDGEMCWFLFSPSPYECGTFKVNNSSVGEKVVSTTSAIYPSSADGYTRLGTFSGLKRNKAFHQ